MEIKRIVERTIDNYEIINGFEDDCRMSIEDFMERDNYSADIEKWKAVAEEHGWQVDEGVQDGKVWVEFSQTSPAGEDFSFTIWPDSMYSFGIATAIALHARSYSKPLNGVRIKT